MQQADKNLYEQPKLSDKHEQALRTFRKELLEDGIISEEGDSLGTQHDWLLLRFLRARNYNVHQAKVMLKTCMEWRRTVLDVGIDEIYRRLDPWDYPERSLVFKHWPIYFHKTDKKGWPINIQALGAIDIPELYKGISPERFWEYLLSAAEGAAAETIGASSYVTGRSIDSFFVIVDLKGFGLTKFWQMKNLIVDAFQISQDYYPETLGALAVINAPYTISVIWNVLRPFLSKETQEKVMIFGSDYQSYLLEHIDAENLPVAFGGTCTCEGLGGCQYSNAGPWMEGRKERREAWLKGERARPELGLVDREEQKHGSHECTPAAFEARDDQI